MAERSVKQEQFTLYYSLGPLKLLIRNLDLLFDGYLPRDSMVGDRFREVLSCAKPLIDYAFKVDKPGYIRVWWFDRYLGNVVDMTTLGRRPKLGRFYTIDHLKSATDREVAEYLIELGWQVRFAMLSIDRIEYIVLVVFSAEGAIMKADERYHLLTRAAEEELPLDDRPWVPEIVPPRHEREVVRCSSIGSQHCVKECA